MKKLVLAAAFALATSTAAFAQGSDTSSPPPADMIHDVMGHVSGSSAPKIALPTGVTARVGETLPQGIALNSFPAGHRAHMHSFVRVGDTVLLVDPTTRRVMHVIR